jgi:hypothetical protein
MNVRLALASIWVPAPVRRARLRDLLRRSADAFGVPAPPVSGQSHRELLRTFATFSAVQAEMAHEGPVERADAAPYADEPARAGAGAGASSGRACADEPGRAGAGAGASSGRADGALPAGARARLRATACDLGRDLRRTLRVRTPAEAMKAARLVYALLGIDFEGAIDGTIVIRHCGFSRLYTPRACAVVSGLDEGLLAGLTDRLDGRLEFSTRITEGCARCQARFRGGQP